MGVNAKCEYFVAFKTDGLVTLNCIENAAVQVICNWSDIIVGKNESFTNRTFRVYELKWLSKNEISIKTVFHDNNG